MLRSLRERSSAALWVAVLFLLPIDCLLLWGAVVSWSSQPEFGWSLPLRVHSGILFFIIASTVFLAVFALRRPGGGLGRAVYVAILSIIAVALTAFVTSYPQAPKTWLTTEQLAELGLSEDYFAALSTCEQVRVIAQFGYDRIDWGHDAVLVPDWMDQSLRNLPKPVLADCFEREITSQLIWLKGDNQAREIATKKIYALYLEADFLNVLYSSPSLLAIEESLICQKGIDTTARLSMQYYGAQHHAMPSYNYFSRAGKQRLKADICQQ